MDKFRTTIEKELGRGTDISIVDIIDQLIEHAYDIHASDIHIDPQEHLLRIRFRIDGILEDSHSLPKKLHQEIISRIKIMSNLRTDEHQSAQDGRFRCSLSKDQSVDVRVSIVPTYHGENVVLRLLSDTKENFTLESLGFSKSDQNKIATAIKKPTGMILVTGPTGSGKTTTLYTLIKMLNSPKVSIITIEDPIEYAIEGMRQVQVNPRSGLTFANGLRSILRQDPDIIMVGEIRDVETASIAINTALTGHLLLSTLHTNDTSGALPRLLDMKIEPFLVSSTVSIVIGQRLVRKICESCKEKRGLKEEELKVISDIFPDKTFNKNFILQFGRGCESCSNSGYKGRIVISEVLTPNEAIQTAIVRKAPSSEIKRLAIENSMTTMLSDGFTKISSGLTTIEELLRVINE